MNKKPNFWIVTELFYPEETSTAYILTQIANKLSNKYQVNVICGPLSYGTLTENSIDNSIRIIRLNSLNLNKNYLASRLIRQVILSVQLSICLFKKVSKNEKVLIVTNPALLLILISFLRQLKKFDLSIIVHDVFPENTIPARIIKSNQTFIFKCLKRIFDRSYSKADRLISIGSDMTDILSNKLNNKNHKPPIFLIENWADTIGIKSAELQNEKIILQYAGNIGRVQGLEFLLELISKVKNTDIEFNFIGEGAIKKNLIEYCKRNNLNNVLFHGSYKREQQNQILNSMDIGIVTLSDGMYGLGVPSKAYNILAAGKPILFIGKKNTEIGRMVENEKIGFVFSNEERLKLLNFFNTLTIDKKSILKEMGNRARNLAEEKYSESTILNKYYDLL